MSDTINASDPFQGEPSMESAPGRSLAPVSSPAGLPLAPYGPEMTPRTDVIRGGMDPNSLFHSFRRRWLLAICMGAFAGAVGAVALYLLFPESSSAKKQFIVHSKSPNVTGAEVALEEDFEILRRTQMVLIQSPFVLNRALGEPGIVNLSFFRDVPEIKRVKHLQSELRINFPQDSEVMEISLSGSFPEEELKKVVKAVSDAYQDEVIYRGKTERLKPREILIESLANINRDIIRKSEQVDGIKRDKNPGFSGLTGEVDPETRLLTNEAMQLAKEVSESKNQMIEMSLEFEQNKSLIVDTELLEQRIGQAIDAMPETQYLEAELLFIKSQLRQMAMNAKDRRGQAAMRPLQEQYDFMASELETFKSGMKKRMIDEERKRPNADLRLLSQAMQKRRAVLAQQIQTSESRIEEIIETLRERGASSIDVVMRQNEIEGLRALQSNIATRIQHWDIEASADSRIEDIPGIETDKGINTLQRYAISGLGGLASFALTCFGIAYMEFRNRRLNGPEQIDEGLGIRVIGTLPGLSNRRALGSRDPVVAQLTESIDSVRTALMHESTSRRRQIVMVTSAATMEGRTTVASQLAASLARAGRRTLLIDGDLRHPALHNLFDVPLEDGLCEVLRTEADVADVIRPTHAEGLWLITAGYVDADAVHALATDQVQPIIEKLRADYDFIIIDSAPVLGLSDSLLFGQHCDGAILSVLRDHTSVPNIHKSSELLKSVGIRLIGSVVNGVVSKADRRVTHLQAITPKSEQKQLEQAEA